MLFGGLESSTYSLATMARKDGKHSMPPSHGTDILVGSRLIPRLSTLTNEK